MKIFDDWRIIPCILEVDLRYRNEFHDLRNDHTLAPAYTRVNNDVKLIRNLNDIEKCVLPTEILKLSEGLGLEIGKILRGLRFEESDWLKQYSEMNTTVRAKANKKASIR